MPDASLGKSTEAETLVYGKFMNFVLFQHVMTIFPYQVISGMKQRVLARRDCSKFEHPFCGNCLLLEQSLEAEYGEAEWLRKARQIGADKAGRGNQYQPLVLLLSLVFRILLAEPPARARGATGVAG